MFKCLNVSVRNLGQRSGFCALCKTAHLNRQGGISFWILVFDIHLTFEFWHLTLNVQDFRLGQLIGTNQGQML
jgi:hypothetical protein